MCPNINLYLSDVEAIINNLEIRLINVYYRLINNSSLFKTNLKTSIHSNLTDIEKGGRGSGIGRDKSFQRIHETESGEIPLKTAIAENIKEHGAFKSQFFKNQSKDTTKENVLWDKETK